MWIASNCAPGRTDFVRKLMEVCTPTDHVIPPPLHPGTNPGTGTAYRPTPLPTVGPYTLPRSGLLPGSGRVGRVELCPGED